MLAQLQAARRVPAPCASSSTSHKQSRCAWPQQRRGCRPGHTAAAPARAQAAEADDSSSSRGPAQLEPIEQLSTSYSSGVADGEDDSRAFAIAMAKIAWETKAADITVLHVEPVVYWTRYMLICTVYSRPQLNAILGKILKEASQVHDRRLSQVPQGIAGGWELLDYSDVVLHIMTAEQREYYSLEDFYAAADEVELPFDTNTEAAVDTWTKTM